MHEEKVSEGNSVNDKSRHRESIIPYYAWSVPFRRVLACFGDGKRKRRGENSQTQMEGTKTKLWESGNAELDQVAENPMKMTAT